MALGATKSSMNYESGFTNHRKSFYIDVKYMK